MDDSTPNGSGEYHEDDENALVKLTSLVVLGAGLLAMFLDFEGFWLVFALGFAVLVPLVKVVTDEFGVGAGETTRSDRREARGGRHEPETAPDSKQDALDTLRDRYARGELSEAEFEHKVERLLETETLEGARDHVARESADRTGETERSDAPNDAATGERDRETEHAGK